MEIEYFNEENVREWPSGRLFIGQVKETKAPVLYDPETGLVSFGCGMIPPEVDQ